MAGTLQPEKKCVELSGRLCFLTGPCFFQVVFRGSSDLVGTLQPEKKGPVENHSRPDDCTFLFSGHNLEAAKIWRERYNRKKTYSRLAGYIFQQVAFVLVLVQIDLIHFEHTKCISSTIIKTNTYPLHFRSIHTILCKIGHMI